MREEEVGWLGEVDTRWKRWAGSRERGMIIWGGRGEVCKGEEERTKRGRIGLPSFYPFLSLQLCVERETELWGVEGPPRCSGHKPHL